MGSTKGVQPSWRLATITMQTIPNTSCHQRFPVDVATRMSAVLIAVTAAASLFLYWLFFILVIFSSFDSDVGAYCVWIHYCAVAVGRLSRVNFYCVFPLLPCLSSLPPPLYIILKDFLAPGGVAICGGCAGRGHCAGR